MLCRCSPSFWRVGHVELFARRGPEELNDLLWHFIKQELMRNATCIPQPSEHKTIILIVSPQPNPSRPQTLEPENLPAELKDNAFLLKIQC